MMQFIDTFYANPLLKFLVDTTLKSIVIFTVAGLLTFLFPSQIGGNARFCLGNGNSWMSHRLTVFSHASEVGD